jgi:hypothetical protein
MNLLTHRPDGLQFAGLSVSPVEFQHRMAERLAHEDGPAPRGIWLLIQAVEDRRKTYQSTRSQSDMKAWITASDRLFSADTRKQIASGQL